MQPLFIGYSEDHRRLELGEKDLQTHVHCVGASRVGKSKLTEWVAREIIRQPPGPRRPGLILIDPHGALYHGLLEWLAYWKPHREVLLFDPSYEGRVVGFNPFRTPGPEDDIGVYVNRRIQATLKGWGIAGSDETPRLERWLKCSYHTLIERGLSFECVRYLLTWKNRRVAEELVRDLQSPLIQDEWETLRSYTRVQDFDAQIESSRNKVFRFLYERPVRRTVGLTENSIDVEDIIENGKILLVNLQPSAALSEQSTGLLGALLLNEIWEVGMRRKKASARRSPRPVFIVLDEFQKFISPDVAPMLDQGAGFGLHLFLVHQHLAQLREEDRRLYQSVMTNARIKLAFGGLTREDARAVVDEVFFDEVDPKRVKWVIEQTKFRPVYTREKVYTSGQGRAEGYSSGISVSKGLAWDPSTQGWVDSSTETSVSGSSGADSWNEGEADIPFLRPEEFKEMTGIQTYTLEETLRELTDHLMQQWPRHFMIRRPGKKTIAGVTPFLNDWPVRPEGIEAYVQSVLAKFLPPAEVDARLEQIHQRLLGPGGDEEGEDFWGTQESG